ncbi:MAG: phage tail sheath C-terminal domain-containing protein [Acidimicrobiia bacterium]
MPIAPTYPGVYIEEIPSGVHTITGVSTSITAFIGYTQRGSVDKAVHIFSFADFERAFGGLSLDSPLSYCVRHFFQNGGTEAYVVRVASGAAPASVTLKNSTSGGTNVLVVTAASAGTWGNSLQIDVDYDTANPWNLFNIRVAEFIDQNGQNVLGRTEVFRNLSMNSSDASYVVSAIAGVSQLITVARPTFAFAGNGTSTSGHLTVADAAPLPANYRIAFTLNGQGPFEEPIPVPTVPASASLNDALNAIITDITAAIGKHAPGVTGAIVNTDQIRFTATTDATHPAEGSSIHLLNASHDNIAARLKLGLANGGVEVDAAAAFRPAPSGTTATVVIPSPVPAVGSLTIDVMKGAGATAVRTMTLPVWGAPTSTPPPTSIDDVVTQLGNVIAAATATEPYLVGATTQRIGNTIQLLPGTSEPNLSFHLSGTAALGLDAATAPNVARYAPGNGSTALAQVSGSFGNDGTAPGAGNLRGSPAAKSGMYALEDVDLFNLLVIPDATVGAGMFDVLTEAIEYCTKRRAFMLIDAPEQITDFAQAQTWIGSGASPLRSRNAALFFPRMRQPDSLMNGVVRTFPVAGAMAGLYARTDAERGVWKAPAGTAASIVGATGLSYTLTDGENGTLNPHGLNCLRMFPVFGAVSWGARTARGDDAMADEYKYVPIRRLALFLEESLYRGTQWAVFEPNDEPLWAQIRLNLGAFMHTLFAQGAFQGRTPRDAYFVKCDAETTTQNDRDLGRVNIVVGFAPLKPAEFVIIQLQQMAGAIQT